MLSSSCVAEYRAAQSQQRPSLLLPAAQGCHRCRTPPPSVPRSAQATALPSTSPCDRSHRIVTHPYLRIRVGLPYCIPFGCVNRCFQRIQLLRGEGRAARSAGVTITRPPGSQPGARATTPAARRPDRPAVPGLPRPRRRPRRTWGAVVDTPVEPGDTVQIIVHSRRTWRPCGATPSGLTTCCGRDTISLCWKSAQPAMRPAGAPGGRHLSQYPDQGAATRPDRTGPPNSTTKEKRHGSRRGASPRLP